MVAGILAKLGIDMGRYLLPPSNWCQRGHYEDMQFTGLHRILTFPHGDKRRIRLRLPAEVPNNDPTLAARYRRAVACRKARGVPWGVKDPRLAFVCDRFVAAAGDAAADIRVVVTRRDPEESIRSVMAMFNLSFTAAEEVVTRYRERIAAELATWACPQLEVDYATTLADPAGGVRRIAEFVGLPPTRDAAAHVDPGLRRYGG
jgi:hypothetical protein